ncbi:hypothetical protein OMP38_28330 [Cohnella ginsengisoli]|uniref:Extracellular solute-binding protein n=1 Tax=Cohnella ginsengisoli TaxID=425004 RepID=A0A9X4KLK9_9BACL|nr:hypothetical protein [Cohnella ginsengisoli]MDG0794308.1 hypothetical protein [Cohnella ginsengisoli]
MKVGWQEYNDRLHTLISTGSPFDIAFATDYAGFVQRGAWLKLDDYLSGLGREMYDAIDPVLWQGVRMEDGGIYGVPTNKELAVRMQWMYPESLVRKYGIDIANYGTLESLEPLLGMIKDKEPAYQPMELDKDSQNFFALDGYEYVTDKPLPLMVRSLDPKAPVVGIFETEEARQVLDTLRAYYLKGYINEDAALREGQNLKRGRPGILEARGRRSARGEQLEQGSRLPGRRPAGNAASDHDGVRARRDHGDQRQLRASGRERQVPEFAQHGSRAPQSVQLRHRGRALHAGRQREGAAEAVGKRRGAGRDGRL